MAKDRYDPAERRFNARRQKRSMIDGIAGLAELPTELGVPVAPDASMEPQLEERSGGPAVPGPSRATEDDPLD